MYDRRDIDIIAQVFRSVAPTNPRDRGRLIIEVAIEVGLWPAEIERALQWHAEKRQGTQ